MKLFRPDSGKLVELRPGDFDYEQVIQNLLEKSLGEIFPGLQFVKSEYPIEEFRADTIAFDTERMSFVIIEYKNVKNKSVIDQGITYYNLLQDNREAFVLLYQKETGKLCDVKDINWDETRVIFITPSFTSYQRKASGYAGVPIELYEIRKYEGGIVALDRIESKSAVITAPPRKASTKPRIGTIEYAEEDYLNGKYDNTTRTPEIKNLYYKLRTALLEKFDKLELKQKKQYIGFYSKDDGSAVCTVEVQKRKMILTYSTSNGQLLPSQEFVRNVSKIGHWGIGNFQSDIKNEEDISKALPLVEKVYQSK